MPVSRRTSEGLAAEVAGHYGRAEVRLLRLMARHLAAGADAPDWAEAKLAELQLFRRRAEQIVGEATRAATADATGATQSAYLRGVAAGEGDLVGAGIELDAPPQQAERAVEALTRAQAGQLEELGPRVVRQTSDAYREAVVRASAGTLSGAATRRDDAQAALDDLARRGVSGFTDAAGRQWGLESYVDMATRTTTAQAAIVGHMDRLEQGGLSLFVVSTSSRECELCRPWEGKVLARGPVNALQRNVLTGAMEAVRVDGTVDEAMRGGLFHPNCTHNLSGYVHGASKVDDSTSNAEGYAEKQEQRRLERGVRQWRRREAAAMSPEAKRAAQAKVRQWQARVSEHVAATGLSRKYDRERFDTNVARTVDLELPADTVDVRKLDDALVQSQLEDLNAAGDFGPRFVQLADELDRRDQAAQVVTLPKVRVVDPRIQQAALQQLIYGKPKASVDLDAPRRRNREAELREEYDTWADTQWLRLEEDTNGYIVTRAGQAAGVTPNDLITRRVSLKHATPEAQEWFAQPGNERLTWSDFRGMALDDKKARQANQRRANRGFESEYG